MPQPERKAPSARKGKRFQIDALTLTGHEKVQLLNTVQTSGWQVVLDIIESCCEYSETEHLQLDALKQTDMAIARNHAQTRGQRLLFERLQAKINLEVNSLLAEMQPAQEADEEDSEERILDPTK